MSALEKSVSRCAGRKVVDPPNRRCHLIELHWPMIEKPRSILLLDTSPPPAVASYSQEACNEFLKAHTTRLAGRANLHESGIPSARGRPYIPTPSPGDPSTRTLQTLSPTALTTRTHCLRTPIRPSLVHLVPTTLKTDF